MNLAERPQCRRQIEHYLEFGYLEFNGPRSWGPQEAARVQTYLEQNEFEQNMLSEVCILEFIVRIHPLSWSCQSNLHFRSAMKTSTNH